MKAVFRSCNSMAVLTHRSGDHYQKDTCLHSNTTVLLNSEKYRLIHFIFLMLMYLNLLLCGKIFLTVRTSELLLQ